MIEIDARGLSCPIPVVKTKKAIEDHPGNEITVLVETATAKENVSRFASSKGYAVQIEKIGTDKYRLTLKP
jgi:tRNA 2-thiouridine synthesizing protein A